MKKALRLEQIKSFLQLSWIPAIIVLADQITKYYVLDNIPVGRGFVIIPGFLEFIHTTNTGSLFSLFQGATLFLLLLSFVVIGIVLWEIPHEKGWWRLGFLIVLGGAIGNTIDRVLLGHVVDFIHVVFWPVFNIADTAITSGIGVLLFAYFKEKKTRKMKRIQS